MHRVQKLLSNYGYCSRRKGEELIEQGRVQVNGKIISLGDKATESDEIKVDGKIISSEKKIYLMFHKPINCVTALTDSRYKTVIDYINLKERIFPVGRLDYKTSGLLLLTNDGDFANNIMHPRYEIKKTYLVRLERELTSNEINQLKKGVELTDGKTRPARVLAHGTEVEITIHEGKNRIVRRMFDVLKIKVLSLKRIKVGKLSLGDLKSGKYKILSEKQKKLIFK